ncbi:hypothetical protein GOBAR_AA33115 [Gossypium barbadense]|uniref:Uncharacterized protein n=1 Tax=Gossypium barbadense TaxID=3634 RepID=A0A2P5W8Z9_GOSBA|nr:hypothetical protein GOBAR_AA33115 [Gossypium barbadense]
MTKDRTEEQFGKFVKLLKKLHINLPFIEVLSQMPNSAKFLKELLSNKRKLDTTSHMELNAVCSAILKNELPNKLKDPGSFTIPCLIGSLSVNNALADLGASDDAVTLQAHDPVKTSKTQANAIKPVNDKTNIQSSLQELLRTKTIETVRCYHEENNDVHDERRLRIEELDEWREHKSRTHDKSKLRKNKPDTSSNQLKVGDTVLLDAVDPHIITTTPNEEISLTVLSIFPFGTVEVIYPKFGTFKSLNCTVFQHTRPGTRACLKPWPNRGRNTAVRYGCVKARHDFPKTWSAINLYDRTTWPWVNLIEDHGCGNENPRVFQGQGLILFLRHKRATRPCHSVVYNNTRACYHKTQAWEK